MIASRRWSPLLANKKFGAKWYFRSIKSERIDYTEWLGQAIKFGPSSE